MKRTRNSPIPNALSRHCGGFRVRFLTLSLCGAIIHNTTRWASSWGPLPLTLCSFLLALSVAWSAYNVASTIPLALPWPALLTAMTWYSRAAPVGWLNSVASVMTAMPASSHSFVPATRLWML